MSRSTWPLPLMFLLLAWGCAKPSSGARVALTPPFERIPGGEEDPAEDGPDDETTLDGVEGDAGAVPFTHFTHASNQDDGYGIACRVCHHATPQGEAPEEGCRGCHRPPDVSLDPAHAGPDDNLLLAGDHQDLGELPPVLFNHFTHASSHGYKLACATCHHTEDLSKCTKCHGEVSMAGEDRGAVPKAKRAFHRQCKGCHAAIRKNNPHSPAPTHCDACHSTRPIERLEGSLSLQRAYHLQCIGCHERRLLTEPDSEAPARACGDCHADISVEIPGER